MLEVFISEVWPIDGLTTGAISISKIATLAHESGYHTVKCATSEVQRLAHGPPASLARAQSSKVLGGFGYRVCKEFHHDTASWASADHHVKEHHWICHRGKTDADLVTG